jgi:hypothetical protein
MREDINAAEGESMINHNTQAFWPYSVLSLP